MVPRPKYSADQSRGIKSFKRFPGFAPECSNFKGKLRTRNLTLRKYKAITFRLIQ